MFQRPSIKLPVLQDLSFDRFLLRDRRRFTVEELDATAEAYRGPLQEFLDVLRPDVDVCGSKLDHMNRYFDDMSASPLGPKAFAAANLNNPLYAQVIEDETTIDMSKPSLTFGVYTTDTDPMVLRGLIMVYNIEIERDTPGRLTFTGMPSLAYKTDLGHVNNVDNAAITAGLLETDLISVARPHRQIDLVEWRFPQREAHAWTNPDGTVLDAVVNVAARGHNLQTSRKIPGKTIPTRLRRNGA